MDDKDKELTPTELREDLAARVPGLEQLAEIPGVVPTEEEPTIAPGEARFERVFGGGAPTPVLRAELIWVLLLFAVLAAVPLRAGLFQTGRVTFGMDQALHSEPWSTVVEERAGDVGFQNQGLSDQAVNFYPFYRWVSASWLAGDPPLWNPLIYCGAPGLGNPQAGVLDPQVAVLAAGEAMGGLTGFHLTLNWTAWLRLALAGLGAYMLARRLGLGARGAALAGLCFQFSGYMVLWLNFPLGHVPPFLPWVLWGLEGLVSRGVLGPDGTPKRFDGVRVRGFVCAAVSMALAILGGHPETSFFVGLTAGLWCLALLVRERSAGWWGLGALGLGTLVAAPALLAFWRYLQVSGAMAIRAQAQERTEVAWLALLFIVLVVVLALGARRLWLASWERLDEPSDAGAGLAAFASRTGGLVVVWMGALVLSAGGLFWLFELGLEERAFLSLVHDYWGHPARGGFQGPGTGLLETGSTWLVTAAWLGAGAALVGGASKLRMRGVIALLGGLAFALALGLPGVLELYRQLPLVGLGDTVRFAPVAALMVGLLAGAGLEAPWRARLFGLVPALAVVLALVVVQQHEVDFEPRPGAGVVKGEEWLTSIELTQRPGAVLAPRVERLEGWYRLTALADGAGAARAQLILTSTGGDQLKMPLDPVARPLASTAPMDARFFRSSTFQTSRLAEGEWDLAFALDAPGTPLGVEVDLGSALKLTRTAMGARTWVLLVLVLVAFASGPRAVPLVLVLTALQALDFAEGQNPTYDAALVFPETATERLLAAELGAHRYFSELGVLPPDTGLVRGLRALDGYDAIDPVSYNELRRFALQPGKHPLLAWHARGVDLESPAWRMLGVRCLLFNGPMEAGRAGAERWELAAAPTGGELGVPYAEVWIYRARDPFPRAWGVTELAPLRATMTALASPGGGADWDPLQTALVAAVDSRPWPDARPVEPAGRITVGPLRWTNTTATVDVEVDGDALLVLSEQYFPGAHFEVDGERRDVLRVNGLFVACRLEAGDRVVRLVR